AEDINQQIYQTAYNQAFNESGFGTGGPVQRGMQAATAAVQGLAGGNLGAALTGASAPYLAGVIKQSTGDNPAANTMAHAVLGAVTAYASGNHALAGAAGAATAELMAPTIISALGWDKNTLTEGQKQAVSALSTLAAGLAGGLTGDSTADALAGGQAGKNAVENNALSATDEKKRQDAKWSLPYLEGDKKAQAEKLISDLNAKDKAFDAALKSACQGLSSVACQGIRQELAAMGKSYDEQMDGQYIGTMASVYQEGAGKVDSLIWQYTTEDVKAQKAKDIQTIASNWGVSVETASTLYTGMAITHTTAAIGGAVYGMYGVKGETVPVVKGSTVYPEGMSFRIDQPAHLSAVDGFTQKSGISGGHNANAFYDAIKQYNVKIVSETPTGVKGITEVKYQIPTKDRSGNLTGEYKATPETKTVYDPNIFTDQKILDLGQQAAVKGYKDAMASKSGQASATVDGVSFRIYVDKTTGTVRNFHPN
ncbi:VENN motif pre-toxin domain-containing protein, partial [Yersinia pseudotuberculosis]